ncbi:MAG: LPS export ABC transporter permease LptF [Alphaproteobacteria bacterium]|nr:LPS export ABC transporter permease LptF [Alphaproteobacteria bacterium]
MHTLNFYIIKQILAGLIMVSVALLTIVWLTQSLRLIDMIVTKGLSGFLFIKLTLLLMPSFLVILMPIALFAVTLFVYNRMSLDRELVVMHACGLRPLQIAKPAVLVGLFLTFFAYFMTFQWVPQSVVDFKELQWTIRHDVSHIILQEGEFNEIGKGFTVYVRKRDSEGNMYGLLINDQREGSKATIIAERGRMIQDLNGAKAIIENGSRQEVDKKTGRFSVLYFDRYTMDFGEIGGDQSGARVKDPRELSFTEILEAQKNPNIETKNRNKLIIELNKRFVLPLYNLCFALIAVTFLIRGNFSRRGQSEKVFMAVICMLFIQSASLGIENAATRNPYLVSLMYINALLPSVICLYILSATHPFAAPLRYIHSLKEHWHRGKGVPND